MSNLFKKLGLIIIITGIYFIGIREIRSSLNEIHYDIITAQNDVSKDYSVKKKTTILKFDIGSTKTVENWVFKLPFGMFFLFGCIGLVLVDSKRKDFLILVSIHLIGGIISTAFMWIGINSSSSLLIIPDALSRYFIPLCSLGLVALVYIQNKNKVLYED